MKPAPTEGGLLLSIDLIAVQKLLMSQLLVDLVKLTPVFQVLFAVAMT